MSLKQLRWIGPVVVAVMLSGPAFASAGLPANQAPARPAPAQTAPSPERTTAAATTSSAAPGSEAIEYGEREQQSAGLEDWQGGAGIYIGGSALALALLIVLLIILL